MRESEPSVQTNRKSHVPVARLWFERAGLVRTEAKGLFERTTHDGIIPEPVRLARFLAGGTTTRKSRGLT